MSKEDEQEEKEEKINLFEEEINSSPTSSHIRTTEDELGDQSSKRVVEKLKRKGRNVVAAQLEYLKEREKKMDANLKEMEELKRIMLKEKEEITAERQMERTLKEVTV